MLRDPIDDLTSVALGQKIRSSTSGQAISTVENRLFLVIEFSLTRISKLQMYSAANTKHRIKQRIPSFSIADFTSDNQKENNPTPAMERTAIKTRAG